MVWFKGATRQGSRLQSAKCSVNSVAGIAAVAVIALLGSTAGSAQSAHPGGHGWQYSNISSPGTTEASDAECDGLTPTVYVENGRIKGGRFDGRRYRGVLWGSNDADIIFGTDLSDRIYGRRGDDIICGFAGNDKLYGERGLDRLFGGIGNDVIRGNRDDDMLSGGSGRDKLYGDNGADQINGDADNDKLFGGRGADALDGGDGEDRLDGGRDTDSCINGERDKRCEAAPPTNITVADVEGLNSADATQALAGLSVNINEVFDDTIAAGLVITQTPAAGTEVATGSTVTLTVSLGASSTIAGRVTDATGQLLQGIAVSAASTADAVDRASQTDGQGEFAIELSASADYVLQVSADDYADQVVVISAPAVNGIVDLDITLTSRAAAQAFDEDVGGTVAGSDGASVTLSPDSFEAGTSSNFEVSITPLDVSNSSTLAAFPGDFSGTSNGATTPIVPLGTVEFEFTSNGEAVNLLAGQTATIELPIYIDTMPDGSDVEVGDQIELWSLDEDTGVWLSEGLGEVVANSGSPTGLALRGVVSHFSWWNCDVSLQTAEINVIIQGGAQQGTALIKGNAPTLDNWRGTSVQASPITFPDPGSVNGLIVPAGIEVCYSACLTYADGSSGTAAEVCQTATAGAVVDITLTASEPGPLTLVTSPAAVANGDVVIEEFLARPIPRVVVSPGSAETSVTYSVTAGALPAGLSLNVIDATRAEIVGTPTEAGTFALTVQGVDADNTTAAVEIVYKLDAGNPPPVFRTASIFRTGDFDGSLFLVLESFLDSNLSGPVTSWSLAPVNAGLSIETVEIGDGVEGSALVAEPGIIPVVQSEFEGEQSLWYTGTLTAIGPGGQSSAEIQIFEGIDELILE